MSFPPSKYSPEYYKPQKPENHSCCGGGCGAAPPEKETIKRGCFVRYKIGNTSFYKVNGSSSNYRTC